MSDFDHDNALAYRMRPAATDADVSMDVIIKLIPSDQRRECCICGSASQAGQLARVRFEIRRGTQTTSQMFRACTLCCAAMAVAAEDGGRALDARRPNAFVEQGRRRSG